MLINYSLRKKKKNYRQLKANKNFGINLLSTSGKKKNKKWRIRNWNSETKEEDIVCFTQRPVAGLSTLSFFTTGTRTAIPYESIQNSC